MRPAKRAASRSKRRGSRVSTFSGHARADRAVCASCSTAVCSTPRELGHLEVQAEEIAELGFVPVAEALELLSGPLRRRVRAAVGAHTCQYLEDGRPVGGVRRLSQEPGIGDVSATFEAAIGRELSDFRHRDLRGPASVLSERYRSRDLAGGSHGFAPGQVQAYLATRVPATFAATRRVLSELSSLRPDWEPRSILDVGAGPGTATWAAKAVFPSIEQAQLVEREPEMAALGARLAGNDLSELLADAAWTIGDAVDVATAKSDLVVAAYVLGELGHEREQPALQRWWGATRGELVLVEPGTPAGFERLRAARRALISWGAQVTAPCPHDDRCPVAGPDWCHFSVRLQRSNLQQRAEGSTARIRGREVLLPGRVGEPAVCTSSPARAHAAPAQGSREALAVRSGRPW